MINLAVDPNYFRPAEVTLTFEELVRIMVEADRKAIEAQGRHS